MISASGWLFKKKFSCPVNLAPGTRASLDNNDYNIRR